MQNDLWLPALSGLRLRRVLRTDAIDLVSNQLLPFSQGLEFSSGTRHVTHCFFVFCGKMEEFKWDLSKDTSDLQVAHTLIEYMIVTETRTWDALDEQAKDGIEGHSEWAHYDAVMSRWRVGKDEDKFVEFLKENDLTPLKTQLRRIVLLLLAQQQQQQNNVRLQAFFKDCLVSYQTSDQLVQERKKLHTWLKEQEAILAQHFRHFREDGHSSEETWDNAGLQYDYEDYRRHARLDATYPIWEKIEFQGGYGV